MVEYVKQWARQTQGELNDEERDLVAVSFKYQTGQRRAAWRVLSVIQKRESGKGAKQQADWIKEYKSVLEEELVSACMGCLDLLTEFLIPNSQDVGKVFLYKMKGDYYRYLAEFSTGDKKNQNAQKAQQAYMDSLSLAKETISPTHPWRLGLALNQSVFYYEIMQNPEKALHMARQAFDDAIADLDQVEGDGKETTLIMQLIRDNVTLWTSELMEQEAAARQN